MLEAARELHKFFHDAKEVLAMIHEKENLLTDDLGRDLNSLHQLQVVHQGFEADLAPLGNQVWHFYTASCTSGYSYHVFFYLSEVTQLNSIFPATPFFHRM